MNYDEYLLQNQYVIDESGDEPEKIWLVIKDNQILYHSRSEKEAREMNSQYEDTEFAFVFDRDFHYFSPEKTIKLATPVK